MSGMDRIRALVRRALVVGGVAAAVVLAPAHATAQTAQQGMAIIQAAADRYKGVEALCADFTQHLRVPLLGDERTGSGQICQAKPNKFAMRFTDPDGDRIVIDGASVWVYYPSVDVKQVLRTPVDPERGGHDFHREFLDEPERKYEVTYEAEETVEGRVTHRLRLVPRTRASYRSAVIWIDRATPTLRQIRVEEENGTVRTITLRNIDFASDPGGSWFTFTPPAGALVISG